MHALLFFDFSQADVWGIFFAGDPRAGSTLGTGPIAASLFPQGTYFGSLLIKDSLIVLTDIADCLRLPRTVGPIYKEKL
jgi:hypothetical protein